MISKQSAIVLFAISMQLAIASRAAAQFPPLPKLELPGTSTKESQAADDAKTSAALSGARRGLESILRAIPSGSSQGAGFSSPLVDAQTAKSMGYDNQIKAVNTYFQKRQLNRMYRNAEKRYTARQVVEWSKKHQPERLSAAQFNRSTLRLNWPVVLRADRYQSSREEIDRLIPLHVRAGGGVNTNQYATLSQKLKDMKSVLKTQTKEVPIEQYISAKEFVETVAWDIRQPSQ